MLLFKSRAIYFIILSAAIFFSSCEKDQSIINGYSEAKIYDDPMASGENSSMKISAGKDRLYMVYGLGSAYFPYINGVGFTNIAELQGKLMSTDLNGELLWRTTLPSGLAITTPVELSDGSCIVSGANLWGYSMNVDVKNIYFFRFDKEGNQLSSDSLDLESDFGPDYNLTNLDILQANSGNILVYGTTTDYFTSATEGFAFEYNPNGTLVWFKKILFRGISTTLIEHCIKTNDGGYSFLGVFPGNSSFGDPMLGKAILIKTDANCDSTWSQYYDYFNVQVPYNIPFTSTFVQMPGGNYRFCVIENTNGDYKKYRSFLYEVSNRGDSLKAFTIQEARNSYCPSIINDKNGNTLALINEYPVFLLPSFNGYFTQINSTNYTFNNDLNLVSKAPFQIQRSNILNTACTMPDGRTALFGLFGTNDYQSYKPGLLILN